MKGGVEELNEKILKYVTLHLDQKILTLLYMKTCFPLSMDVHISDVLNCLDTVNM
jgi:hypothetical protein